MTLATLSFASFLYVLGGIAMKYSNGFGEGLPTLLVFVLFGAAAGVQNWAMKGTELGGGYVFVLGLEAILAVLAGAVFFQETLTLVKGFGAVLVVIGIVLLKL